MCPSSAIQIFEYHSSNPEDVKIFVVDIISHIMTRLKNVDYNTLNFAWKN